MHKPLFASLTVLHYFAGTSHPPIKIRSPSLDVHLHPRFGLTWNLVADFGILESTILAVVTHCTTNVQHGHTIYHDRTVTIYPGIPFSIIFFNPLALSFFVVLVVLGISLLGVNRPIWAGLTSSVVKYVKAQEGR